MEINELELGSSGSGNPLTSKFEGFFNSVYKKEIEKLVKHYPEKKSLEIDFNILDQYDYKLADELLSNPGLVVEAAEEAIQGINIPALEIEEFKPNIRFLNLPKQHQPTLKNLGAKHLGRMICVEGVIRQLTDVLPKLKTATWKCRRCANTYIVEQDTFQTKLPSMCANCKHRDFELVAEKSTFIDYQKIQIQEPLELLKGSEQAVNLDVYLEDDLVNRVSPGDKTKITGVLKLTAPSERKNIHGRHFEAVHLEQTAKEFDEVEISKEEEDEIRKLAKSDKIYDILAGSIAPHIYGHQIVKESIAMQLFGGVKKKLPGDISIRGNIHVLLVGDPGCLVGDERIVLGNGTIERIGKIGSEHLQELKMQVLTGEGGKKRDLATCFHYYKQQPVMEIITESGKSIKGTFNHPILSVSKENGKVKREWKRLDEFKIGDKVATATSIPCTITKEIPTGFRPLGKHLGPRFSGKLPQIVSKELAALLGYCVGDGWVQKYRLEFIIAEPEIDILPTLTKHSEKIFGIKPRVLKRKLSNGRTVQTYYASIHSQDVAKNLEFLREKRVPELIMRSGNAVAAEFIKWLFEADGTVFSKGRGRRAVSLKAKNIELLRDVQVLLLRFSIHSRIVENALQIRRGKDIIKYSKNIGFASQKKKTRLEKLVEDAKKFGRFNSQRSERIVKIVHHALEDVFDIEVPKTHRFIANGIISHNTAKSQLLQSVSKIAPRSIYVAGKTSSAVGLCVAPDSLILNENGFKPIEEFVESKFDDKKAIEEIPGAFSNPSSGNASTIDERLDFVQNPVEKIWRIQAPEKMIKFTTRTGRELSLTPATPLIRLKNGRAEWIPAGELQKGDYIATPRLLPEGHATKIHTFNVLLDDPHIKIADSNAEWIKEIIQRLLPKYKTKQAIAKKIGKSRDTIYAVQNPKFHHGWELGKVVALARESGFSDEEISKRVTKLFIRHGKTIQIPQYLDNPDLAYLVGAALGDGSIERLGKRTTIRICGNDPEILIKCKRILKEQFGVTPETEKSTERVPSLRFSSRIIGKVFYAYGMQHTKKNITLSHLATEMPNSVLKELLSGLFDTDGFASRTKKGSMHVGISTISPALAQTIQLSLAKFGIISKKRLRKTAGRISRGKKITVISRNDQHYIEIRGKENLESFRDKIGFHLERKQNALEEIIQKIGVSHTNIDLVPEIREHLKGINAPWTYTNAKNNQNISYRKLRELTRDHPESFLKKLGTANIFWDRIKLKETFKPDYKYVYDFTVAGSHNFIANGIYVHNTASAVKDEFGEGGWTLKAGALVLASGGNCMVDEFDKMETEDRSAMHEAMEQGMVSVAKAGIVTRFKTDTSILAAANPKFSRFDPFQPFIEQIELPPSLISRFDLFFMIRDILDRKKDENIASHILKTHQTGEMMLQSQKQGKKLSEQMMAQVQEQITPQISGELLKKYISFARQNIFPVLSDESLKIILEYYLNLRESGKKTGTFSATHRQLEGLVRLSEASARVRLSDIVEPRDAERAIRLVKASLEDVIVDPETGQVDFDMVLTGQTQSKTNHIKKILTIIRQKATESDMVAKKDVIEEAVKDGMDQDKVNELIGDLKKRGDVYEPRQGFLKPTQGKSI